MSFAPDAFRLGKLFFYLFTNRPLFFSLRAPFDDRRRALFWSRSFFFPFFLEIAPQGASFKAIGFQQGAAVPSSPPRLKRGFRRPVFLPPASCRPRFLFRSRKLLLLGRRHFPPFFSRPCVVGVADPPRPGRFSFLPRLTETPFFFFSCRNYGFFFFSCSDVAPVLRPNFPSPYDSAVHGVPLWASFGVIPPCFFRHLQRFVFPAEGLRGRGLFPPSFKPVLSPTNNELVFL